MIYRQVLFKDWSDKMKHKLEYTIASVLAVSSLGLQTLPLYAQEMNIVEQEPVEIKTAKDFKEQFLCLKKIEIKDGKEEISYQLIETIDDTNYEQILAGKLFYEQLSLDVSIETKDQSKALKEEIDALFKNEEEPIDFEGMVQKAIEINEQIDQEESEKVEETEEKEEQKETEDKKEAEEEETEDKQEEVEEEQEEKPVVQEETEVLPVAAFTLKNDSQSLLEPVVQPVIHKEVQPEVQPVVLQEQKLVQTEVKQETKSSGAQSFVDTYLTSSMGAIYTKANSVNYNNILNGLSAWNKLSASERNQVNAILRNSVGKTYQNLLQEAQAIKAGYVMESPTVYVNTATQNNTGLWALICSMSAAMMAFLFKKSKEESNMNIE